MKIRLNKYWIKYLANLPESGMGYQEVNVRLKNGRVIKDVLVLNAEELEIPDTNIKITLSNIAKIKLFKHCENTSLTR